MKYTVSEIKHLLANANESNFSALEGQFGTDVRKSVQQALGACKRRLKKQASERQRIFSMYAFERKLSAQKVLVGLDEVGRGPLAGPVAVGGVVLPEQSLIFGLNDSKRLTAKAREKAAEEIKDTALAWHVAYVSASEIDAHGISWALKHAFKMTISKIDEMIKCKPEVVLLDGNALHIDPREKNIVKGDAKCASIAAASIVAKVARDRLMVEYAKQFPQYHFDSNKGYGSEQHIAAIKEFGLCPLHRKTFCSAWG